MVYLKGVYRLGSGIASVWNEAQLAITVNGITVSSKCHFVLLIKATHIYCNVITYRSMNLSFILLVPAQNTES